ncbi:nucleotidyltransferase family protein [Bacteroidota bacterium]
MKNSETLFFVGKCLGIRQYPERIPEIRKILKSGIISWESFLWESSKHLVLPALFVQLRESQLLNELPDDLVDHFEHLYQLNCRRNKAILAEAHDIITVLNTEGIAPVFLKGTAHLLDELYADQGERMIGDIDFLVAEHEIFPAVKLLERLEYTCQTPFSQNELNEAKHYPRLRNEALMAAVEIHRQPVSKPYDRKFNFAMINKEKKKLKLDGNAYVLSDHHQIIHNMMNVQMNDKAFSSWKIYLRHIYDLLQLSQRKDPLETAQQFACYPRHFNAYLVVSTKILDNPASVNYQDNQQARRYYCWIQFFINHPKWNSAFRIVQFLVQRLLRYVTLPIKCIYNKGERKALMRRLGDRSWYKNHLKSYRGIRNL